MEFIAGNIRALYTLTPLLRIRVPFTGHSKRRRYLSVSGVCTQQIYSRCYRELPAGVFLLFVSLLNMHNHFKRDDLVVFGFLGNLLLPHSRPLGDFLLQL